MVTRLAGAAALVLVLGSCDRAPKASSAAAPLPPSAAYRPGAALENPEAVTDAARGSACASVRWPDRGRAPISFVRGMALVHAQSFCELGAGIDGPAAAMSRPPGEAGRDALSHYGLGGATAVDRLRELHALGIGLGMRESSGTPTEGRDMAAGNTAAETAEAGLFQTSFNSMRNGEPWLRRLHDAYRAAPDRCYAAIFAEGARSRTTPEAGTGPGAEFQRFTKSCPAFAADYAMLMLRVDRGHYGPVNRREAEVRQVCREMLLRVEQVARCR